tara:strand:+ start:487 stop:768 length:282 start_codon:yes stop_codon:yes gene_type:complete
MQSKYKIFTQPRNQFKGFPFYDVKPGSNECFFVPRNNAGNKGALIRYYAKIAGVKITLRQRTDNGVLGYFVWVKSIEANRVIPPPPEIQHAAE